MDASRGSPKLAALTGLRMAAILGMAAFLSGCGGGPAVVSGKVRYKDQPLTTGEVSFIAADGKSRSGLIGTDGTYQINDAPVGPVTIVVVARQVEGGGKGGSPMAVNVGTVRRPSEKALIPPKYADPATSGLKFDVAPGKQQIKDIDLTD